MPGWFQYEVPLSRLRTPSETQNDIETNHNSFFFFSTDSYSSRAVYILAVALACSESYWPLFFLTVVLARFFHLNIQTQISQNVQVQKKKGRKKDTHFGISFNGFWLVLKSVDWNGLCPFQSRCCSQVLSHDVRKHCRATAEEILARERLKSSVPDRSMAN